ncbi:MAG: 2-deoxy-D-gluconate 3-dehydrogenase [Rhodospirillaceae bacterium]|nr:2-deoxy-D-gluconate 3-dehydrogenase [Rhodospirillaceae bacterium]
MTANFSLAKQVALVTGASSGLGEAFAGFLADAGAQVVLGARRADRCAEAAAKIGENAASVMLDVTNSDSIEAGLDAAEAAFGTVDIVINNAGTVTNRALVDMPPEEWRQVIDTNLTGCFLVTQAVARRMIAAETGGRIVNVSSMLGETPAGQVHAYSASKAGINQLTRTSAMELARHNISVNALAPGYIQTDLNTNFLNGPAGERIIKRVPQRRFGQISDLEGLLLLLTSPAGGYMTGEIVTIDGGLSLSGM